MMSDDPPPATPTIGLLGGLGLGAGIHYYRALAAAHGRRGRTMQLALVHASIATTTACAARGDRRGLAVYLAGMLTRLRAAGATFGVVPALTPHICIDELETITPLPLVDITRVVAEAIRTRGLSRVALFGTRFVIESDLFGRLGGVAVRPRASEIEFVHDAYSRLAHTAEVRPADRARLVELAETLRIRDGVDAIVLAGTDLTLMFDPSNTPFPHVDCAGAHVEAVMRVVDGAAGPPAPAS